MVLKSLSDKLGAKSSIATEVSFSKIPKAFFASPINFVSVVISVVANALFENTVEVTLNGEVLALHHLM